MDPSEIEDRILKGKPVMFSSKSNDASKRTVRIEWILEAVNAGHRIEIDNAIIKGTWDGKNTSFKNECTITKSTFENYVDLSRSQFDKLLNFLGSEFLEGFNFDSTKFRGDVLFNTVIVSAPPDPLPKEISFNDSHFDGVLDARNIRFNSGIVLSFERAKFNYAYFDLAVFHCQISFQRIDSAGSLSFVKSKFLNPLNFSGAEIKGSVNCDAATFFAKANFENASTGGSFSSKNSRYLAETIFARMHVGGDFELDGARFKLNSRLNAEFIHVGRNLILSNGKFRCRCDFSWSYVGSSVLLQRCEFRTDVTFRYAKVGSNFDASGIFQSEYLDEDGLLRLFKIKKAKGSGVFDLSDTNITGNVLVSGAPNPTASSGEEMQWVGSRFGGEFNAKRSKIGSFSFGLKGSKSALVKGLFDLSFAKLENHFVLLNTELRSNVKLDGLSVGTTMNIFDCRFTNIVAKKDKKGKEIPNEISSIGLFVNQQFSFEGCNADLPINFYELCVARDFFLRRNAFRQTCQLDRMKIGGTMHIAGTTFIGLTNFSDGSFAKIDGQAYRREGNELVKAVAFEGRVVFDRSIIDFVSFENFDVKSQISLNGCKIRTLKFSTEFEAAMKSLPSEIDLSNCTFESISVNEKALVRKADGSERIRPYDRGIFNQLERNLLASGERERADKVHLLWRASERRKLKSEIGKSRKAYTCLVAIGTLLLSLLYWGIANYGVRPFRLLGYSLIALAIGGLFFHQPGSVSRKISSDEVKVIDVPAWKQAFGISIGEFLPIDIPWGGDLLPSDKAALVTIPFVGFSFYADPLVAATILKLLGYLLVPLGVGALAGLLRRPI